jgi:hypothetical protein
MVNVQIEKTLAGPVNFLPNIQSEIKISIGL